MSKPATLTLSRCARAARPDRRRPGCAGAAALPHRHRAGRRGRRALAATAAGAARAAWGGSTLQDALGSFFQDHYQRMTPDEIAGRAGSASSARRSASYGVAITCEDTPPLPNTVFGYALNISKCKGYRDCVEACVQENNQGRDSQVQYIRVLQMDKGTHGPGDQSSTTTTPQAVPVEPASSTCRCSACSATTRPA